MNLPTLEPYLASQPPASDWQARMIDERRELAERLDRLMVFLSRPPGERPPTVDTEDWNLLCLQAAHMTAYLDVLDRRIARF